MPTSGVQRLRLWLSAAGEIRSWTLVRSLGAIRRRVEFRLEMQAEPVNAVVVSRRVEPLTVRQGTAGAQQRRRDGGKRGPASVAGSPSTRPRPPDRGGPRGPAAELVPEPSATQPEMSSATVPEPGSTARRAGLPAPLHPALSAAREAAVTARPPTDSEEGTMDEDDSVIRPTDMPQPAPMLRLPGCDDDDPTEPNVVRGID